MGDPKLTVVWSRAAQGFLIHLDNIIFLRRFTTEGEARTYILGGSQDA